MISIFIDILQTSKKLFKKNTYRILMVLDEPDPFRQPVITITLSPVLEEINTICPSPSHL